MSKSRLPPITRPDRSILRSQTTPLPLTTSLHGITYSNNNITSESSQSSRRNEYLAKEAIEIEIVKCIVLRDEYISKLRIICKHLKGKFNSEISHILDLIRATTVDVTEHILHWRLVLQDHSVPYIYNGSNHLLSLPSDLDFLESTSVIRRHMGFSLLRNPFIVPLPMEQGSEIFSQILCSPAHIKSGKADAYSIGGASITSVVKLYSPIIPSSTSPYGSSTTLQVGSTTGSRRRVGATHSYVLNDDMRRVRLCELMLIKEEERYGRYMRDAHGRCVPIAVALSKFIAADMGRDDHRPMTESATVSSLLAPFAELSGVGSIEDTDRVSSSLQSEVNDERSKVNDPSVNARLRGLDKVKGALSIQTTMMADPRKFVLSRQRSSVEVNLERQQRTLHQKLAEIEELKAQIKMAKTEVKSPKRKSTADVISVDSLDRILSNIKTKVVVNPIENNTSVLSKDMEAVGDVNGNRLSEVEVLVKLDRVDRLVHTLSVLKDEQRASVNQQNAIQLEAKRRLISPKHIDINVTSIMSNERNVYDIFAIRIQSLARKYSTRIWYTSYICNRFPAAIKIQAYIRGYFCRKICKVRKVKYNASSSIQAVIRSKLIRILLSKRSKERGNEKNAILIQRTYRRVLGKRRVLERRAFNFWLREAVRSVSEDQLLVTDLRELADRIHSAAVKADKSVTFPPDEVLQLLNMVACILKYDSDNEELFHCTNLTDLHNPNLNNSTLHTPINCDINTTANDEQLSWVQISRILYRSNKFLRSLRLTAYKPSSKPPLLIHIPSNVLHNFVALQHNPQFSYSSLHASGVGSRCAAQLFLWLQAIVELHSRQKLFLSLIETMFPSFFTQLWHLRCEVARISVDLQCKSSTIRTIQEHLRLERNNEIIIYLTKTIELLEEEMSSVLGTIQEDIDSMLSTQLNKELEAMQLVDIKINDLTIAMDRVKHEYSTRESEPSGASNSYWLQKLRRRRMDLELQIKVTTDRSLIMRNQHQINNKLRAKLFPIMASRYVVEAGEQLGKSAIISAKMRYLVDSNKVSDVSELSVNKQIEYEELNKEYTDLMALVSQLQIDITSEFERMKTQAFIDINKYEKIRREERSRFTPCEREIQEERLEDVKEAMLEVEKRAQFVPESVLYDEKTITRNRPILLVISRDVSASCKKEILDEICGYFPGKFITIDTSVSLGIVLSEIQACFDACKHVVVYADVGLTSLTRCSFLSALHMITRALIPSPGIVIAIGSERCTELAYQTDTSIMRERTLKEAYILHSQTLEILSSNKCITTMINISNFPSPPCTGYTLVLEALLVFLTGFEGYKGSDFSTHSVSWRCTRKILQNPKSLLCQLHARELGNLDVNLLPLLSECITHGNWPSSSDRSNDELLHALCMYVESGYTIEYLISQSGGLLPINQFVKHCESILSTVIVAHFHSVRNAEHGESALVRQPTSTIQPYEGWTTPVARIISAVLRDVRVYKTVISLDNQQYRVDVYREKYIVYFTAYLPSTSEVYTTAISTEQISLILAPDSITYTNVSNPDPPASAFHMYQLLTQLLVLELPSKSTGNLSKPIESLTNLTENEPKLTEFTSNSIGKQLFCRKRRIKISSHAALISGYRGVLTCYSATRGDLYFTFYIQSLCVTVNYTMDANIRAYLEVNSANSTEIEVITSQNYSALAQYAIDRLKVSPSHTMYFATLKPQLKLHIRKSHSCGKVIYVSRIVKQKTIYIIKILVNSVDLSLIVYLYNPINATTYTIHISYFLRSSVLRCTSSDCNIWCKNLINKINFYDNKFIFNTVIHTQILNILNKYYIIKILAYTDSMLILTVYDKHTCYLYKHEISLTFILTFINNIRIYNYSRKNSLEKYGVIMSLPHDHTNEYLAENGIMSILSPDMSMCELICNSALMNEFICYLKCVDTMEIHENVCTLKYILQEDVLLVFDKQHSVVNSAYMHTKCDNIQHLMKNVPNAPSLRVNRRQLAVLYIDEEFSKLVVRSGDSKKAENADVFDSTAASTSSPSLQILPESALLSPESAQLSAESTQLSPESAQLSPESAQLSAESAQLSAESAQLSAESAQLSAESVVRAIVSHLVSTVVVRSGEKEAPISVVNNTKEIAIRGETLVFKRGLKVVYREGSNVWHKYVCVEVVESRVWKGEEGVGRKYRFILYESQHSIHCEGTIEDSMQLQLVLGLYGQDLLDERRREEMLLFICKHRLVLVKRSIDGETAQVQPVEPEQSEYLIEFKSDRLYSENKITPVNISNTEDSLANSNKMFKRENTRGKKILRTVMRVGDTLLQLVVFEVIPIAPITPNSPIPPIEELAPLLRIIGYDPKTKQTATFTAPSSLVLSIAGGTHSSYLQLSKRKELGKLICDKLRIVVARRGKQKQGFELTIPFNDSNANENINKLVEDSSVVFRRAGKIGQFGMRVCGLQLLLTFFSTYNHTNANATAAIVPYTNQVNDIYVNAYSVARCLSTEIVITEQEQIARIQHVVASYSSGSVRATAIRRLCRYLHASLVHADADSDAYLLSVTLLPPSKEYLNEYANISLPDPKDDPRVIGAPEVFLPLNATGPLIHRRVVLLMQDIKQDSNIDSIQGNNCIEFLVSIYCKDASVSPDKGVVIKAYDMANRGLVVMHVGSSLLQLLASSASDESLLSDVCTAYIHTADSRKYEHASIEALDDDQGRLERLVHRLSDVIITDLRYRIGLLNTYVLYFNSADSIVA